MCGCVCGRVDDVRASIASGLCKYMGQTHTHTRAIHQLATNTHSGLEQNSVDFSVVEHLEMGHRRGAGQPLVWWVRVRVAMRVCGHL